MVIPFLLAPPSAPVVALPRSATPGEAEILALLPPEARGRYAGEIWDRAWRPDGSRVPRILNAVFPNERPLEAENGIADREGKGPYVILGYEESGGARVRRYDEERFWPTGERWPDVALLPVSRTPVFPVPARLVPIDDIIGRFASVRRLERPLKRGDRLRVLTRTGPWREALSISVNGLGESRSLGSGPWGTLRYVSRKEILDAQLRKGLIGNWGQSPAQVELVPPPGGAKMFVRLATASWTDERDDRAVPSFVQGIWYNPPEALTKVVIKVAPMRERVVPVAPSPRFGSKPDRIDASVIGPFRFGDISVGIAADGVSYDLGRYDSRGRRSGESNATRVVTTAPVPGVPVSATRFGAAIRLIAENDAQGWEYRVGDVADPEPTNADRWFPLEQRSPTEYYAFVPYRPGKHDGELRLRRSSESEWRVVREFSVRPVPETVPEGADHRQKLFVGTDGTVRLDDRPVPGLRLDPANDAGVMLRMKNGEIIGPVTSVIHESGDGRRIGRSVELIVTSHDSMPIYFPAGVERRPQDVVAFILKDRPNRVLRKRFRLPVIPKRLP